MPLKEKKHNVVLIEFVDEAKALLNRYGVDFFRSENMVVVSLHPKVQAYLKAKGIPAQDTIPFFDNEAQKRIVFKTEELAEKIAAQVHISDDFGFKEGYKQTIIYHTRFYINHFLWILEILAGIEKKYGIKEIYACLSDGQVVGGDDPYIQDEERFLGILAKEFCARKGIGFYGTSLKLAKLKEMFMPFLAQGVRFFGKILTRWEYARSFKETKKGSPVIVPALSYRMDAVVKDIKKNFPATPGILLWEGKKTFKAELYKIYFLLNNYFKQLKGQQVVEAVLALEFLKGKPQAEAHLTEEFDHLKEFIAEHHALFVHDGVSFGKYLSGKINSSLKAHMISLQASVQALVDIYRSLNPRLVMSMYSLGVYYFMGEVAQYLNIPSISISHGTHVPPNNEFERIENYRLSTSVIINRYQHVAMQTPWAESFLDYYQDKRPRVQSGPLLYSQVLKSQRDQLRREMIGDKPNAKIIIHAATQKTRYGLRFYITETLDEYIASLKDLVVAINSLENVYLVIRPHPICDISKEDYRQLLPLSEKILIADEGSFARVLTVADLLVSYSSTCIEEALQNHIPVVLYDKWKRYKHFPVNEVGAVDGLQRNPVYYFTEPRRVKDGLMKVLNLFKDKPLSKEELSGYVYPENSKENFTRYVEESLKGDSQKQDDNFIKTPLGVNR